MMPTEQQQPAQQNDDTPQPAAPVEPLDRCEVTLVHADLVDGLRDRLPRPEASEAVAELFKLLADASRCRLMVALVEAGELCVCDLAAVAGMSQSNVSHHLRVLRAASVVRARRAGKMVYYSPDDEHVRLLLDVAYRHMRHGSTADEAPQRRTTADEAAVNRVGAR
jgi:ArsR family transcriptional regulator, lead/cadmium/zinc/bismuth-responsive transcriptional repressor